MKEQTPGSRIPPFRAAAVAGDLYNSCACLHVNNSRKAVSQSMRLRILSRVIALCRRLAEQKGRAVIVAERGAFEARIGTQNSNKENS